MDSLEAHLQHQIDHSARFFWHRLRWEAVSKYLPAGTPFRLLDIGAGAGLLGEYLRRERPDAAYYYIEPIPSIERHLETRFGPDRNARLWADYRGVDVVTMLDVIEHQSDDTAFLQAHVDRMDPGSTLVATVPALTSLWSEWDVRLGHHRRYAKSNFGDLLRETGLQTIACDYLFPELVVPGLWRRRRTPAPAQDDMVGEADFPELPAWVNEALYRVGRLSSLCRRWSPVGTSVFAVARRPAA